MTSPTQYIEEREALLGVVVGKRGIGKTHLTLQKIRETVLGENGCPPRRVLIFDVNDEFRQFKTIALKDIKAWCDYGFIEVRRVCIFKDKNDVLLTVDGKSLYNTPTGKMSLNEMAQALFYILAYYYMGLLLIEDINKYVSDSLPADLIGAICTQRHKGVDIIMHFQQVGRYGNPKILANANYLRFHKVSDSISRHESKFEDVYEPLCILENIVNAKFRQAIIDKRNGKFKNYKEYKNALSFYAYWDKDEDKIRGNFTKLEFIYAVRDFLQVNYKKYVAPKINQVKLGTGEKLYKNKPELIGTLIRDYISDFYGN